MDRTISVRSFDRGARRSPTFGCGIPRAESEDTCNQLRPPYVYPGGRVSEANADAPAMRALSGRSLRQSNKPAPAAWLRQLDGGCVR